MTSDDELRAESAPFMAKFESLLTGGEDPSCDQAVREYADDQAEVELTLDALREAMERMK